MATSGTVDQTLVTVDTLISHAVTRAGKLPATVGGELLERIREALYFICSDLGNTGINLWCMQKSVVNVVPYQTSYALPNGTNDITMALYRTLNTLPGTPVQAGAQVTVDLVSPVAVTNVQGTFATSGYASLAIEYSTDNVIWFLLTEVGSSVVTAGSVFIVDIDASALARYWRVRDTSGTLLPLTGVYFRTVAQELNMAKLNKDEYMSLPNKQSTGGKALQYWFDKQISPAVWVWPMSNQPADQMVFWQASQVQDPGDLQNSLAVPSRWYQALIDKLSYRAAMLIPPPELLPGRLETLKSDALESETRASDGESDGSSYRLAPRIGGYTA